MFWWCALATAVAVLATLAFQRAQIHLGIAIAKPIASLGFIGAAFAKGAFDTPYGRVIFAGLALGWLGDVLLIPKSKGTFLAGLAVFLLGHVAYVIAFWVRGADLVAAGAGAVVVAVPSTIAWRWLSPHIEGGMRVPVAAYVLTISVMVALAAATAYAPHPAPLIAVGAAMFYGSDLSVARDQFVKPGFVNVLWGLPLYYAAQFVLAASVAF
jgi:uncharacterized membrane protein YhhN